MLLVLNPRKNRANVCEERLPTKARVRFQDLFQSLKLERHCILNRPWLSSSFDFAEVLEELSQHLGTKLFPTPHPCFYRDVNGKPGSLVPSPLRSQRRSVPEPQVKPWLPNMGKSLTKQCHSLLVI